MLGRFIVIFIIFLEYLATSWLGLCLFCDGFKCQQLSIFMIFLFGATHFLELYMISPSLNKLINSHFNLLQNISKVDKLKPILITYCWWCPCSCIIYWGKSPNVRAVTDDEDVGVNKDDNKGWDFVALAGVIIGGSA